MHGYRCLLFTSSEYGYEAAIELDVEFSNWMVQDRKILWRDFGQNLVMLHNKRAKV
jgi:hypothetical protein